MSALGCRCTRASVHELQGTNAMGCWVDKAQPLFRWSMCVSLSLRQSSCMLQWIQSGPRSISLGQRQSHWHWKGEEMFAHCFI